MKRINILGMASILISSSVMAALPPYFQRAKELQSILNDQKVYQVVQDSRYSTKSSGVIDSIQHIESHDGGQKYRVISGGCKLAVVLAYQPSYGMPGPIQFKIAVGEDMVCTE